MLKCAIYARVSTDEQGTSIVNQQEYFKEYIIRNKYEVYDIYTDEAFSGTETTKRLSFQRLMQDGKDKKYDILLAKSYSRFGRNQRETLTALAELFENGIRIIFIEDGLDSQRDKGQFGLFAWLAEQEARKVSERIKLTWQHYNQQGRIHTTNAPHGYEYNREIKNFVINESEAEIVRLIFNMYLKGDGVRRIANFLNANGYRTKAGCEWSMFLLKNILSNEFYIGSLVQGKRRTIDVTIKKLENIDPKEWIVHKNNHEAILSEQDFFAVQELYQKRSKLVMDNRESRQSNSHLFSNIVKCKICGATFTYKRKKVENYRPHYSCGNYEQKGAKGSEHKRNSITEELLIHLIKSELARISKNDFNYIKDCFKQKKNVSKPTTATDIKKLDMRIEEKTNLSMSLLTAYAKGMVGEVQYKLQNETIEKELKILMEQKEKLIAESKLIILHGDEEKKAIQLVEALLGLETGHWTNEMMKRIVERIEVDMLVGETNIFFKFTVPR